MLRRFRRSDWTGGASGYLLVEVLVASAILVFGVMIIFKLFTVLQKNVTLDRSRLNALNEARRKLEYVKGLSYEEIGVGVASTTPPYLGHYETNFKSPQYDPGVDLYFSDSIPLGNGIVGKRWVIVKPQDDPVDGIGVLDADKMTVDYKKVVATVRWQERSGPMEVSLATEISGTSESVVGGGGTTDGKLEKTTEKTGEGKMGMGAKSHPESMTGDNPADELPDPSVDPDEAGDNKNAKDDNKRKDNHANETHESFWKYDPITGEPVYD
jgi:hypothetical protein